jgi:hypothetical protein
MVRASSVSASWGRAGDSGAAAEPDTAVTIGFATAAKGGLIGKMKGVERGCLFKGLQLRLELGNVVTGEGERGESGSWRLPRRIKIGRGNRRAVGKTDVCETSVTHKPLSTTIHDTKREE